MKTTMRHKDTGVIAEPGETIKSFRGDDFTFQYGWHHKVVATPIDRPNAQQEYYVSVFNLELVTD